MKHSISPKLHHSDGGQIAKLADTRYPNCSGENLRCRLSFNVGEAEVSAAVVEREFGVIQPQQV